jgi:hypothetical protein
MAKNIRSSVRKLLACAARMIFFIPFSASRFADKAGMKEIQFTLGTASAVIADFVKARKAISNGLVHFKHIGNELVIRNLRYVGLRYRELLNSPTVLMHGSRARRKPQRTPLKQYGYCSCSWK